MLDGIATSLIEMDTTEPITTIYGRIGASTAFRYTATAGLVMTTVRASLQSIGGATLVRPSNDTLALTTTHFFF